MDDPEFVTEWEINETKKQYEQLGLKYIMAGYSRRGRVHMPPRVYGVINRSVSVVEVNSDYL